MPTGNRLPLTGAGRAFLLSTLSGADLPTYGEFADNVGGMANGNGPLLDSIAAECLDNEGARPDGAGGRQGVRLPIPVPEPSDGPG